MTSPGGKVYAEDLDALIDRRVVRLRQTATQSLPDNTATAITFGSGSEEMDTHGLHNEASNPTRITFDLAGVYEMKGSFWMGAITTPSAAAAWIRHNGLTNLAGSSRTTPPAISNALLCFATIEVDAGDYVELIGIQDSAGAIVTNVSTQFASCLEATYVRAAL